MTDPGRRYVASPFTERPLRRLFAATFRLRLSSFATSCSFFRLSEVFEGLSSGNGRLTSLDAIDDSAEIGTSPTKPDVPSPWAVERRGTAPFLDVGSCTSDHSVPVKTSLSSRPTFFRNDGGSSAYTPSAAPLILVISCRRPSFANLRIETKATKNTNGTRSFDAWQSLKMTTAKPLQGLKVVEFAGLAPGPFAGSKIEEAGAPHF